MTPKLLRQLVSALICRKDICQAGLILYHCLLRFPFSVWFEGMYKIGFVIYHIQYAIFYFTKNILFFSFFTNKKIYWSIWINGMCPMLKLCWKFVKKKDSGRVKIQVPMSRSIVFAVMWSTPMT